MLTGQDLAQELIVPGPEHVGPGLDRVLPASGAVHREFAPPAHAAEMRVDPVQLGFAPGAVAGSAVADHGPDQLVPVAEHVGLDPDPIADAAFGRVASAVDRWCRVLDDDPARGPDGRVAARRLRSGC